MPDQHVYAIASGKGGVGKTTTAVSLGAVAAADGRSVAVVDADLGMPDVAAVLDVAAGATTLHDVLAGEADAVEAATPAPGGFDVLAGAADVEKFGGADPAAMRDVVAALREAYDLVLLDTGAGLSHATVVPLGLADATVVVTTPDPVAVGDATRIHDLAGRFGGEVVGVVVVGIGGGGLDPEAVAGELSVPLLASVPADPAVRESAAAGKPLPVAVPDSPAASAYREAAAALLSGEEGADADEAEADEAGVDEVGADEDEGGADEAEDADGVTLQGPEVADASVPDGEVSIGADGPADATVDERSVPDADASGVSFPDDATTADDGGGVTFSGPGDGADDPADRERASVPGTDDDAQATDDVQETDDAAAESTSEDPADGDESPNGDYVRGGAGGDGDGGAGGGGEDSGGGGDDGDDGESGEDGEGDDDSAGRDSTGDAAGADDDHDSGRSAGRDAGDDGDESGESRSLLSRLTGGLLGD